MNLQESSQSKSFARAIHSYVFFIVKRLLFKDLTTWGFIEPYKRRKKIKLKLHLRPHINYLIFRFCFSISSYSFTLSIEHERKLHNASHLTRELFFCWNNHRMARKWQWGNECGWERHKRSFFWLCHFSFLLLFLCNSLFKHFT